MFLTTSSTIPVPCCKALHQQVSYSAILYSRVSLFKYDAAFYMALSYLKEKNKPGCKEWLNKIPADAGPYSNAQELLKKL